MNNKDYNYSAAWTLVGSVAVVWEKAKNPLTGAVPNQAKAFFPRIPLVSTTKQYPLKGFFIAAVYEYGRDNQPNDISGNATRTCAGGNGGLYHRASAGVSSLFIQAFKPSFEDAQVCDCRMRRMAPRRHSLKGRATTC